ncbi:MAG: hypothetical protein Q8L66_15885 [Caulobacter sp.]|nr:hypothetical protein [Caulobacter sp.]
MIYRSLAAAAASMIAISCSAPAPGATDAAPDAAAPEPASATVSEVATDPAPEAASAIPSLCAAGESVVFSCGAGDRVISLCATGGSPVAMQYRFGRKGAIELAYPKPAAAPKGVFFVSSTPYGGGGERRIRFTNGDYSYYLFSRTIAGEWDAEGNRPHTFEDGVIVFRGGKLISDKRCTTEVDSSGQEKAGAALDQENFNDELEIPYRPAGH